MAYWFVFYMTSLDIIQETGPRKKNLLGYNKVECYVKMVVSYFQAQFSSCAEGLRTNTRNISTISARWKFEPGKYQILRQTL